MNELTRAVVLLLHLALDPEVRELTADEQEELAALLVLLAKRNRAGADLYNRERRLAAAVGIRAHDEGFAPRQPINSEPHPETVALNERMDAVTVDELVELGHVLTFPESRNQEL